MVVPMGVKPLGLLTLYPTKTETHTDTTENKSAKALATATELPGDDVVNVELPGEISKGIQSQLTE